QNVHLNARPSCSFLSITPKGQLTTQYPHPLQTSACTYTPPNSVRTIEPVGQASRQPAFSQCLHTSDKNAHESRSGEFPPCAGCGSPSTNCTCRHVECPSAAVLS